MFKSEFRLVREAPVVRDEWLQDLLGSRDGSILGMGKGAGRGETEGFDGL